MRISCSLKCFKESSMLIYKMVISFFLELLFPSFSIRSVIIFPICKQIFFLIPYLKNFLTLFMVSTETKTHIFLLLSNLLQCKIEDMSKYCKSRNYALTSYLHFSRKYNSSPCLHQKKSQSVISFKNRLTCISFIRLMVIF